MRLCWGIMGTKDVYYWYVIWVMMDQWELALPESSSVGRIESTLPLPCRRYVCCPPVCVCWCGRMEKGSFIGKREGQKLFPRHYVCRFIQRVQAG